MIKVFYNENALYYEMTKLGIQNMTDGHKDIIKDVERIDNAFFGQANVPERATFYWVVCQHETHLCATAFAAAKSTYKDEQVVFVARIKKEDACTYSLELIDDYRTNK